MFELVCLRAVVLEPAGGSHVLRVGIINAVSFLLQLVMQGRLVIAFVFHCDS